MISDHIKDKLLGRAAMRWAIRLNLGVGLTGLGVMLLAVVPFGPDISAEAVTKMSAGVIAVSAIAIAHCALAAQWDKVKLSRATEGFERSARAFHETMQAQVEAAHHRLRAQAEGRPHEH